MINNNLEILFIFVDKLLSVNEELWTCSYSTALNKGNLLNDNEAMLSLSNYSLTNKTFEGNFDCENG
jgi:hypothetical protein